MVHKPMCSANLSGSASSWMHEGLLVWPMCESAPAMLTDRLPQAYWSKNLTLGAGVFLRDRKSTRLNSSHLGISYAVFCLKKKKKKKKNKKKKKKKKQKKNTNLNVSHTQQKEETTNTTKKHSTRHPVQQRQQQI